MNNGTVELVLGMCIGATVLGAIVFCYALIREIRSLTKLTSALVPLLQNEEIVNGLKSFRLLVAMGAKIGEKMDALNEAIRVFSEFAMTRPQAGATEPPKPASESGVYVYDEEAAASRAAGKPQGEESIDSRVSLPRPEGDHF
jgi:hypothetical protein